MAMSIVFWTVMVGLLAGAVTKLFIPSKDHGEIFTTMFLGVVGAVLGNWVGSLMNYGNTGEVQGIGSAIIGALVMLVPYRFYITGRMTKF